MNGIHAIYQWAKTPEALVRPLCESSNQAHDDGSPVHFQICIRFSCPLGASGCPYDCE
jgi:hypothetical protein